MTDESYAELLKKKKDITIQILELQKELTEINYAISKYNRTQGK